MNDAQWQEIFYLVERKWNEYAKVCREREFQKILEIPKPNAWEVIFKLVRAKKGRGMDGEAVQHYLKDYFDVPDLNLITKPELVAAMRYLAALPDRPPN